MQEASDALNKRIAALAKMEAEADRLVKAAAINKLRSEELHKEAERLAEQSKKDIDAHGELTVSIKKEKDVINPIIAILMPAAQAHEPPRADPSAASVPMSDT